MENIIRKILREEVDNKTQKILDYVEKHGVIKASKIFGGYDNLKHQLKGIDWMSREVMVNTIIDVCKVMGGFTMDELGLEEITLDKGETLLRNLGYIDKNGIEIYTYEIDDDGEWDEEPVDVLSFDYDSKFRNGKYVLDTIHLYEIFDAVIEFYNERNNSN